jgi:DNA adenine methylase
MTLTTASFHSGKPRSKRQTISRIDEWQTQRSIYKNPHKHSQFKVGFASFYLNRCNRSGILVNGGPIGGISQAGTWKIDARFNRENLVNRIEEIAEYGSQIEISNLDALLFLAQAAAKYEGTPFFAYLDPPYFVKGSKLYLNHYAPKDHAEVADYLTNMSDFPWVLTYDDVPEIRALYTAHSCYPFALGYSAHSSRSGKEVLIVPSHVVVP